ncbi:MAG: hypothetical protein HRU19_07980 [Pseudobacteriovorax sp.]|nr:hypothetical protein [Pseudobacteriovorax sp.]
MLDVKFLTVIFGFMIIFSQGWVGLMVGQIGLVYAVSVFLNIPIELAVICLASSFFSSLLFFDRNHQVGKTKLNQLLFATVLAILVYKFEGASVPYITLAVAIYACRKLLSHTFILGIDLIVSVAMFSLFEDYPLSFMLYTIFFSWILFRLAYLFKLKKIISEYQSRSKDLSVLRG